MGLSKIAIADTIKPAIHRSGDLGDNMEVGTSTFWKSKLSA